MASHKFVQRLVVYTKKVLSIIARSWKLPLPLFPVAPATNINSCFPLFTRLFFLPVSQRFDFFSNIKSLSYDFVSMVIITTICKYFRASLPDPLCLSRRNTHELQNPVTQCMYGWRTSVPEALRCA